MGKEWVDSNPQHNFQRENRELVPVAARITVTARRPDGTVAITGAPGAVPAAALSAEKDWVRLANVDWGSAICIPAGTDGSFSTQLAAGPGNTILIAPTIKPTCEGQWIETFAAAVIRVPEGVDYTSPSSPFSISGFNNAWHWIASGQLAGSTPYIQFTLPDGQQQDCIVPRLHVYRLFDRLGEYVSQVNVNVVGPTLTPTGLPIETDEGFEGYWALVKPTVPGKSLTDQCMNTNARYELGGWTAGLDPGWYRGRIVFYTVRPDGSEFRDPGRFQGLSQSPFTDHEVEQNTGIGFLPLFGVGTPQTPRIPATLLNNVPSWGSGGIRGVVANEDATRFALGSRRAAQGPFVASPRDPLSGRQLRYLLEPYLPTLAYTGFGFVQTQAPLIALDDSNLGKLTVSMTKPDGKQVTLASSAPLVQSFISGSTNSAYPAELTWAGPGRIYGVTTQATGLMVNFDQYGQYKVSLDGSLRTLWGQQLAVRGTYEIWVAEPLDLKLGTFEGTPLDVGQEWSPVVVVQPEVPADISVSIDEYVGGDAAQKQSYAASGRANRYGYFVADKAWKPAAHGEYIARITARYVDPIDGRLWMGTRTGASIVATPDSPLIAHGERNSQLANLAGDKALRTWFFTRTFDPNCGEANCDPIGRQPARTVGNYPYFRGDVAWLADGSPVGPSITLEDPTSLLNSLAPQVATSYNWCSATYCVDATDMKKISSHTSAGKGAQQRPTAVDAWGYWYTSSVRADGIHVHHSVSEVHSFHNHWYGHETYNCQIGLPCYQAWGYTIGERQGDEEGDVKLFFGGAVIKSGQGKQFVPYASMGVITPGAIETAPKTYRFPDPKGNRVCPPYQGAAGGLATCGPLLTIQNQPYDLFVTPTGTRPGSVLEPGNTFVFSGQAWPTLDVAVTVTVTSPSGQVKTFSGRASRVGYIDSQGKTFVVSEPGVYTVHVSATQDRPVPSTGLAPSPPIVADGKTVLTAHGYKSPLSAILGSPDSTYHFFVAETRADGPVSTQITLKNRDELNFARTPSQISLKLTLPAGSDSIRYNVAIAGLVIQDVAVAGSASQVSIDLVEADLYAQGFTNVVLGADSIEIAVTGRSGGKWFARVLNLRGVSPLGGGLPTIQ